MLSFLKTLTPNDVAAFIALLGVGAVICFLF